MNFKTITQLALLALAAADVQPLANDSPQDKYVAEFELTVAGNVSFTGLTNGSIEVDVDLSSLPTNGGPFLYHVHEKPVPSGEVNCSVTGGHLNPYNGNPDANSTNELEVGDLSGRHGKLTSGEGEVKYVDQYLSLNSDSPAFIGGRSVTFHYANGTRFACSNITKVESKEPASVSNSSNSSNGSGDAENGVNGYNYPQMFTVVGAIAGLALVI